VKNATQLHGGAGTSAFETTSGK